LGQRKLLSDAAGIEKARRCPKDFISQSGSGSKASVAGECMGSGSSGSRRHVALLWTDFRRLLLRLLLALFD
jgi:hypothetical protein